jgi:hypothetical protein
MTVKSNTAASWLAEVEKRVARLKSSTGEAAWHEAHELVAAAQILRDEIAIESNHRKT